MKIVISGSSNGIGKAIAEKFIKEGHSVIGLDVSPATIGSKNYDHFEVDVRGELPEIENADVVITSAGIQFPLFEAIDVNLKGTINVIEKYAFQPKIKSVVAIASASGINGAEFPEYSASKGGVIAYIKNVALRLAEYKATANSVSPGGVLTSSQDPVVNDPILFREALDESLLKKWATPEEIADWVYFLAVINESMTGQNLLIDNGEMLNSHFVWPK